jgi:hypothetical protein
MHFDARAAKMLQPRTDIVVDGCLGLLRLEPSPEKLGLIDSKAPFSGLMKQIKI